MSATATSETGEKVLAMRKQAAKEAEPTASPAQPSLSNDEREASALQQSIENSLGDEWIRIPIGGEKIRFHSFNGPCEGHPDRGGEISKKVALIDERLNRMDTDDYEERFTKEAEWICMTLGWAAEPEFMDGEWFEDNISFMRCKELLSLIQTERDFSEKQVKNLRRLGRL